MTITCDDCDGIYPISEKEKGDYFLPGNSEDGIAVWICKWCSTSAERWRTAGDMIEIMNDAQEEHDKNCKGGSGPDKDPKPPLNFKPKLVQ